MSTPLEDGVMGQFGGESILDRWKKLVGPSSKDNITIVVTKCCEIQQLLTLLEDSKETVPLFI